MGSLMASLRDRAFTVRRVTKVLDPLGTRETWSDAGTIRGALDMITGTDIPSGGGEAAFIQDSTHVLITNRILPSYTVPTDADRIRDDRGNTYHVTYVDDVTGAGHHLEVYLKRAGAEGKL